MMSGSNPIALTPAAFLSGIVEGLCTTIGPYTVNNPVFARLLGLVWTYLRRATRRFDRLYDLWKAGRLPKPRPALPNRAPCPARRSMPRGRAWLIRLAQRTAQYTGHVQILVNDPEIAAMLAEVPQAGRILRPICQMLGIAMPPAPPRQSPAEPQSDTPQSPGPQSPGPQSPGPPAATPTPRPPQPEPGTPTPAIPPPKPHPSEGQ